MTGSDGQLVSVTGGGPMAITGPMFLCARSDLSAGRFYSGRLANLALYNTSVSAAAMAALYDQVDETPQHHHVLHTESGRNNVDVNSHMSNFADVRTNVRLGEPLLRM